MEASTINLTIFPIPVVQKVQLGARVSRINPFSAVIFKHAVK